MNWESFTHEETTYDLVHLNSCTTQFECPAKGGKAAITYTVDVDYSLHCFTKAIPESGAYDKRLEYADARETRLFNIERYELSKLLPAIVQSLLDRKCFQTGHSNYLTMHRIENGKVVEYEIYFTVSKSRSKGRLNLFIQSAYIRDAFKKKPLTGKPIRFRIILHNTLNKKPIHP